MQFLFRGLLTLFRKSALDLSRARQSIPGTHKRHHETVAGMLDLSAVVVLDGGARQGVVNA